MNAQGCRQDQFKRDAAEALSEGIWDSFRCGASFGDPASTLYAVRSPRDSG